MSDGGSEALERLTSAAAIRDALARYCRGVDRADAALTRSAYHPDATDDHGAHAGPAWDFAEAVNEAHATRWSSTMHVLGQHLVEFDGDVADAETYVVAYLRRIDGSRVDVVGGRYLDRFERRHGDWLIARRTYIWEWSADMDATSSLIDGQTYRRGSRDRRDTSYLGSLAGLAGDAHRNGAITEERTEHP